MDYSTFINETLRAVDKMTASEKKDCLQNLIRITDEDKLDLVWQIVVGGHGSDQLLNQEFKK